MRLLYGMVLCPFSRKIQLGLAEKSLSFAFQEEKAWAPSKALLACVPEGSIPVLFEDSKNFHCVNHYAISEYLEAVYPAPSLMGHSVETQAETRRLIEWFDDTFYNEVGVNLVYEKLFKRQARHEGPDSRALRQGRLLIHDHLNYISGLVEKRWWLVGEFLSWADLTAAAHLSCVDYLGDIPWTQYPEVKAWYTRLKSRPSFRALLNESFPGVASASHYQDLDF